MNETKYYSDSPLTFYRNEQLVYVFVKEPESKTVDCYEIKEGLQIGFRMCIFSNQELDDFREFCREKDLHAHIVHSPKHGDMSLFAARQELKRCELNG